MIITLFGPDAYRRKQKLDFIVGEYLRKRQTLAFHVFDLENTDETHKNALQELEEFLKTPSLFQPVKLVVLKNPFSFKDQGKLKKLLVSFVEENTTLVLSDSAKTIKKDFSFLQHKPNVKQFFDKLEHGAFKFFIKDEAKKRGIPINEEAVALLALLASDSWAAVSALEKLRFLPSITSELLKIDGPPLKEDFFSLISGWSRQDLPLRLKNLEKLFVAKEEAAKVFNILAYQDLSKLGRFADYDIAIKSGKMDYEEALLDAALF